VDYEFAGQLATSSAKRRGGMQQANSPETLVLYRTRAELPATSSPPRERASGKALAFVGTNRENAANFSFARNRDLRRGVRHSSRAEASPPPCRARMYPVMRR
jgi:hypothetical protein